MAIIDVTRAYKDLLAREEEITAAVRTSVGLFGDDQPLLADAVARLLHSDCSKASVFRLLPIPVLGALGGDPDHALPLVVASRIWWTGAEVFDDLADGQYDAVATGVPAAQASIASAACLALVPLTVLDQQALPRHLKSSWVRECVDSSLQAAEGQLADVSSASGFPSWATAMRTYADKCGAPYARDAAMAAQLAGASDELLRGWRAFGRLFGVLRQLANDRSAESAETDEDLINGTNTLLLAHAAESAAGTAEWDTLTSLRVRARHDPAARVAFGERLNAPDISGTYNQRVRSLHRNLCVLLETLADPSEDRDLIRWMLDASAKASRLGRTEDAA
ncbi:polyprenyl synthase [Streptomyces hygroscopicus]|uniref:polyprenyl synthase n=1 Tax=Streptomyces hygroscopicus TaxID=1912 RepID=UPI0022409E70|nr:polyprenyl synthase [Streptomyces hygroscopicus]